MNDYELDKVSRRKIYETLYGKNNVPELPSPEIDNSITIQVEAMAGKILFKIKLNPKDTVGVMKRKVTEMLRKKINMYASNVRFYNDDREELTHEDTDTLDVLNKKYDNVVLAVYYDTMNILVRLLKKYPNKSWNWSKLSRNPNITMEYIENNLGKPWIFRFIS